MQSDTDTRSDLPLPMRPEGMAGRMFGKVMEAMNTPDYRRALALLAPMRGERICEIGFGTGKFAGMVLAAADGIRIAGVDPAATMVDVATRRRSVREHAGRVDLRLGTALQLPWEDGSFDAVVALHSFQFWEDPQRCLGEIRRVLRPEGRVVILLRNHGDRPPAWLPNVLSRSGDETANLVSALQTSGFGAVAAERSGDASIPVTARRSV